jgi:hypothetical protein
VGIAEEIIPPRVLRRTRSLFTTQTIKQMKSSMKLTQMEQPQESGPTSRSLWLGYALPMIVVFSIFLLAYWPGVMTSDSNDQWNQVFTGVFKGWHPAFHTFNVWLLTRLWASPAIVALAQIVATSLVIAWGLSELKKNGAPEWAIWVTVILFCMIPIFPQVTVTLWKDVAYSLSILALSILALKIVFSEGTWLGTSSAWIKLGIVSALVALYRHNGPPVSFGFLMIAVMYYRSYWKSLTAALLLGISLWGLIVGPVYKYFNVTSEKQPILASVAFFGVAAHVVDDPGILAAPDGRFLRRLMPLKEWKLYDCHSASALALAAQDSAEVFEQYQDQFPSLYLKLTKENPSVTLGHIVCSTSYLWKLEDEDNLHYFSTVPYRENTTEAQKVILASYGYSPRFFAVALHHTPIPRVRDAINHAISSLYDMTAGVLWRPALFLYMMLLAILLYVIKAHSFAMSLMAVPSLIQTGIMLILSLTSELRYQYPIFLVGMLVFLPLVTCAFSKNGLPRA